MPVPRPDTKPPPEPMIGGRDEPRPQPSPARTARFALVVLVARLFLLGPAGANATPLIDATIRVERVQPPGATVGRTPRDAETREPLAPPAELTLGDQVNTGRRIRAELRFDGRFLELDEQSALVIGGTPQAPSIEVLSGRFWYRGALGSGSIVVTHRSGVKIEFTGTEFAIDAGDTATPERLTLTLIDGQAVVASPDHSATLGPMQQATLVGGRWQIVPPPADQVQASILVQREIQWALSYPVVLDPDELSVPLTEDATLAASLHAYRSGDYLAAYKAYPRLPMAGQDSVAEPELRAPRSRSERVYRTALLLTLGRVAEVEAELAGLIPPEGAVEGSSPDPDLRLAHALRVTLEAVRGGTVDRTLEPILASEWLAESYFQQSLANLRSESPPPAWSAQDYRPSYEPLRRALVAAEKARDASKSDLAPSGFAPAVVRLAELHFSFADAATAEGLLAPALADAPQNVAAHSLHGFLLTARDRIDEAVDAFDTALGIDPAFGSAWLGRGLCHFRRGNLAEGLADLQQAVAAEPNRALFRSYLAKGYQEAADALSRFWSRSARELARQLPERPDTSRARHLEALAQAELTVGRRLDPGDPTGPLYEALQHRSANRINDAVRSLEAAMDLNQNRAVFRSGFLLDQDRAVQGAALAQVYRDAGMVDAAVREAGRAAAADYGNAAAHLFLASSYDYLRDPDQVNLRYESPWQTELLLSNLLRPVGAGSLSQSVSQQEFARLFEREHTGLYSASEYRSRGDWLQSGSLYGWQDRIAYAFDATYESRNGDRPNQDVEALTLRASAKVQASPKDGFYLEVRTYDFESGDLGQYRDPDDASASTRVEEDQEPIVAAGYHHQWNPGNHTLFLFARLEDSLRVRDAGVENTLVYRNPDGQPSSVFTPLPFQSDLGYAGDLEIYSFELQQIWRAEPVRLSGVAGLRYQTGDFPTSEDLRNAQGIPIFPPVLDLEPLSLQSVEPAFDRFAFYSYNTFEAWTDRLWLTAGLNADSLKHPVNHRFSPVQSDSDRTDTLSPKAGLVLRLDPRTALHAVYSQWQGGVSFDQSFSLEPAQVAGFAQNYRDVFPASLTGSLTAPRNELLGALVDSRLPTGTYVGLQWQTLRAEADQVLGAFDSFFAEPLQVGRLDQALEYREHAFTVNADQLVADDWVFNLRYRLVHSQLDEQSLTFPGVTAESSAWLHQIGAAVRWNHASGAFASAGGTWRSQHSHADVDGDHGDRFWQVDLEAGYRWLQRRLEVRAGVLNLTDDDYRLTPLTPHPVLPRSRTFFAALRLNF